MIGSSERRPVCTSAIAGPLALCIALGQLNARCESVIWLEAESQVQTKGTILLIDPSTKDFGRMAKRSASGERFIRMGRKSKIVLPRVTAKTPGDRTAWVRCFPLEGRHATVFVDGKDVGTTSGETGRVELTWEAVGTVRLDAGEHTIELRSAPGNTNVAYVDCIALIADANAIPVGRSPADIMADTRKSHLVEDFGDELAEVEGRWRIDPPSGDDSFVRLKHGEDDGALHVHNGPGERFTLIWCSLLDAKPGDQVTVRTRMRKGTLCEYVTIVVEGVGSFSPQLYRRYQTNERTWIVPRGIMHPLLVKLIGRGGGDTYISRVEAFRREKPVSSFVTGRFLPAPNLWREGRLFEIERYVVNRDAFSAQVDADGDGCWSLCRLSREENTPYFSRGTVLKSDSVAADRDTPAEGCQPLHVRVGPLEPGRYQVHLNVPGRALGYSHDGKAWRRIAGTKLPELGLMKITEPYFEFWLDDRYADPGNPGPTYVDYIRFMPIEDPAYTMASASAPPPPRQGRVDAKSIALTIDNPAPQRRREPVRSGVPIPKGHLAHAEHVRLLDDQGRTVPACVQVTGRWPDGSVKWLLLDLEADVPASGSQELTIEYGNRVAAVRPPPGIRCGRKGMELRVDTGAPRVSFDAARGGSFTIAHPDTGATMLEMAEAEFRGADGRIWRSSLEREAKVEVEEQNALRATVRLRGRLRDAKGGGPLVFDTRVHLFAGRAEALIEFGFFATEAEATVSIAQARLVFTVPWADAVAEFAPEEGKHVSCAVSLKPRLLQTGGQVHGRGDASPFVIRDRSDRVLAKGLRATGVLALRGKQRPALFCVPYFWQQFPMALACSENGVEVELWAGETPFIAHAGAGKSHRVGIGLEADASPDRWLRPLFARADLEWYCASGAFEELVPRRRGLHEPYEALVDAAFDMQLKERAGYGMENWGDVWQPGYVRGAKTWSNQEWDLVNNWVIPSVRTGQRRYLDFAHEAARHYADVDCIHYSTNPALLGGAWMHAHTSLEGHQLERPNFAHAGWVEGLLNI